MAKPVRPGLTGACGCSTPWVAGLGGCCAKRLELVADFNAELELARKAESDATYGDATYGITHTPPPVSIRREFIVLGDKSPPLEAPDSPGSSRGSRRLFEDERGSDGVLRQDMDVYQLELQRLLEIQLVLERGADEGARPGFTSLYGTMPKEPAPQQDFDSDLGLAMTTAPAATPLPAQARRTYVPDSPGVDVVRRQAAPEARQLRDAYIAAANGNAAPLEVLRAAAEWSGEAEYAPSFAPSAEKPRGSPVPRRAASDTALVTRGPDSLDPVGGRTAVRRGIRHCRHVPMGRRRAVLRTLDPIAVELEAKQEEDRLVEHHASLLELQALALLEQAPSQPRPWVVVPRQPKCKRRTMAEPALSPAFSPTMRARRSRPTYPRLDLSGERRWHDQ